MRVTDEMKKQIAKMSPEAKGAAASMFPGVDADEQGYAWLTLSEERQQLELARAGVAAAGDKTPEGKSPSV